MTVYTKREVMILELNYYLLYNLLICILKSRRKTNRRLFLSQLNEESSVKSYNQ